MQRTGRRGRKATAATTRRLTERDRASQSANEARRSDSRTEQGRAEQETRTRQPNDRKPKTDDFRQEKNRNGTNTHSTTKKGERAEHSPTGARTEREGKQ